MQIVVTAQPEPLLTHDDNVVRQSMALDGTDRDEQADLLLLAAQAELDGPKGKLGFSVAEQSVMVTADSFESPLIRLPGGPIPGSVVVSYLDSSGTTQIMDDSTYLVSSDGMLTLSDGSTWPALYAQSNAVSVAYDVGIEDEDDPRIEQMKSAIIMHAKLHMDFEDVEITREAITRLTSTLWDPSV